MSHCVPVVRESVPRFDLYGELEVSSSASTEVIEAAYRSLAKRHHPDVAAAAGNGHDADRIKRINVAREWLTDPDRRRRYDRSKGFGPAPRRTVRAASNVRMTGDPTSARAEAKRPARKRSDDAERGEAGPAEAGSFGVNSGRVRQFLADLRALDELRALQLRAGRFSVMHPDYSAARRRLLEVGRKPRQAEATFAREAAGVIARGKVADPRLAEEIATIASDIAGAIALRDLLSRRDFELLLAPWTWRGAPITAFSTAKAADAPPPTTAPRPTPELPAQPTPAAAQPQPVVIRPANPAPAARPRSISPASPAFGAGIALLGVVVLAGGIALVGRAPTAIADVASPSPGSTALVGSATDAPRTPPPTPAATGAAPSPPPTPGLDPAQLRALQRGAARTIRQLASAAATGSVSTAKKLLGDSAPGLQASGLAEASFPDAIASDIAIEPDGDGWRATLDDDVLYSNDGETWTFEYADRPLVAFGGTPDHNLFWLDPRHDLFLAVSAVTVMRSEVRVRFEWSYAAGSYDGAFFERAAVWLSSLTVGSRSAEVGPQWAVHLDGPAGAATLVIPGAFRGASNLALVASVSPSSRFTNQSAFELSAR